jgi:ketosteroid isomerase-like protein
VNDPAPHIAATETFLRLTAERRLEESQEFLAEPVTFVYPNGTFEALRDVFAAGERRYRWIRKRHVTWDVVDKDDGTVVVVSAGTLYGENNAGVPFEGVRYVDRITFRDGKIVRQEVWNDLAESGVLDRGGEHDHATTSGARQQQHQQERR